MSIHPVRPLTTIFEAPKLNTPKQRRKIDRKTSITFWSNCVIYSTMIALGGGTIGWVIIKTLG